MPECDLWKAAMLEELSAHQKAGTWSVEDVPSDVNIVGCRWVFKIKHDTGGNPICYKACLIAQGFSQIPGIDYLDTYAPVAKFATNRTLLAYAAHEDWEIDQIDIKAAYLNGDFEDGEVIWMSPPLGFASMYKGVCAVRLR